MDLKTFLDEVRKFLQTLKGFQGIEQVKNPCSVLLRTEQFRHI